MNGDEVTKILRAARDGDSHAAEQFVLRTQRSLLRFCAHLTDPQSSVDLAQETYVRAFTSLANFRGQSSALTWLLGIARHVCADHFRTASRRPITSPLSMSSEQNLRDPADFSTHTALTDLIRQLSAERREAFVLTQLVGLSYLEAAEVCECPVGTIRSRVARARDDLVTAYREASSGTFDDVAATN